MILIDSRTGSGELEPLFRGMGVPTSIYPEMPFGDFMFDGKGPVTDKNPSGKLSIGVERKSIRDMIQSIRSGRFSGHQLPGLIDMYDRVYVIIEGIYQPAPDGLLVESRNGSWVPLNVGSTNYMYSMVDKFVISIEESCGVRFHRTAAKTETVHHIVNLYKEWNYKEYHQRRSHIAMVETRFETVTPWGLGRKVANQLPGIGTENSMAIDRHFGGSMERMVQADQKEWEGIELPRGAGVRKLGKSLASQIWKAIRGEK
jgi:ERCC4-type nuclease